MILKREIPRDDSISCAAISVMIGYFRSDVTGIVAYDKVKFYQLAPTITVFFSCKRFILGKASYETNRAHYYNLLYGHNNILPAKYLPK